MARSVHLLGQAAEGDTTVAQPGDHAEQVRQRAAKAIQLPNNEAVALLSKVVNDYNTALFSLSRPVVRRLPPLQPGNLKTEKPACLALFGVLLRSMHRLRR